MRLTGVFRNGVGGKHCRIFKNSDLEEGMVPLTRLPDGGRVRSES